MRPAAGFLIRTTGLRPWLLILSSWTRLWIEAINLGGRLPIQRAGRVLALAEIMDIR